MAKPKLEPGRDDPLEPLLAQCIDRFTSEGVSAVEDICREHPEHAEQLKTRLASLDRIGLLGSEREAQAPGTIDRYEIVHTLGHGGMGVVYLARDTRVGRMVALKAGHVPIGGDTRARLRFEREIRAVAQLQHPCIVPIFDVGEFRGRPYFTMEYVQGATLARIIEELRARRVSFEELTADSLIGIARQETELAEAAWRDEARLAGEAPRENGADSSSTEYWGRTYVEAVCRLILDVAEALAYTHKHGIVHRDVKPSNILVRPDGRAQLFDLGLAHLEDQPALTRSGDFAGTPFYVAPEQIAGKAHDVDRRTDVYSLGVTLYELLALRRPFEGTTPQVFKQIQVKEPPLLRGVNALVPKDLETICLTAMDKDRECRYPNMEEFVADLRRFLEFRPPLARPIGPLRRGIRYLRRNPSLAAVSVLTGLLVTGLPIGLLWANHVIRVERDAVERAHGVKTKVSTFLEDIFQVPPNTDPDTVTAREVLEEAVRRIEEKSDEEPLVRAELMETLGRIYRNLGAPRDALPLLDRAFALRHREVGEHHAEAADVLQVLATVHAQVGDHRVALALGERSLKSLQGSGAERSRSAAEAHLILAEAAGNLGQFERAQRELERALEIFDGLEEPRPRSSARVLEGLAALLQRDGQLTESKAKYRAALDAHRSLWSPDPRDMARCLESLAIVCEALGDSETAQRQAEEARRLRASTRADGDRRSHLAPELPFDFTPPWREAFEDAFQVGITSLQAGHYDEAIEQFELCHELDPDSPRPLYNMACGYALLGQRELALDALARAADRGFGYPALRYATVREDVDLDSLRGDPAMDELVQRMGDMRERASRYAAEPAVYRPATAREGGPLLVVLHDNGATKSQVVEGEWKRVADELGWTLLAPSAPYPVGVLQPGAVVRPEAGMQWSQEVDALLRNPWEVGEDVVGAVERFLHGGSVDRQRIFLAGEGMGSLLAIDLALRAPGLFRGVALVNGSIPPDLPVDRARTAASIGLGVEVAWASNPPLPGQRPGSDLVAAGGDLERWLQQTGLRARVSVFERPGELWREGLADALRSLESQNQRNP